MTLPSRPTAKQRSATTYMFDVMRRLEWDLHRQVDAEGRIPEEWHRIAQERPERRKRIVTLGLEEDVLTFFRSMGTGYGPRINDVLKSYMYARLAGLVRGADAAAADAAERHAGPKPAFRAGPGREEDEVTGEAEADGRMPSLEETIAVLELELGDCDVAEVMERASRPRREGPRVR